MQNTNLYQSIIVDHTLHTQVRWY